MPQVCLRVVAVHCNVLDSKKTRLSSFSSQSNCCTDVFFGIGIVGLQPVSPKMPLRMEYLKEKSLARAVLLLSENSLHMFHYRTCFIVAILKTNKIVDFDFNRSYLFVNFVVIYPSGDRQSSR